MSDFFDDVIIPSLIIIALAVIFTLPIIGIVYWADKSQCEAKATKQNLEYDYGPLQGCMVKTEKGWMDYDRLIYKKDAE